MRQSVCQGDDDDDDEDDECDEGDEDDDDDDDKDLNQNVQETRQMENIEELLDFFLVANDETRRNVTGLMKVLVLYDVIHLDNILR